MCTLPTGGDDEQEVVILSLKASVVKDLCESETAFRDYWSVVVLFAYGLSNRIFVLHRADMLLCIQMIHTIVCTEFVESLATVG